MKLIVINSNSTGNAYALDSGKEILLLEAGCKMTDVKKAIDFRLQDVVGCLVTHEHLDHAKYVEEYAKNGIVVYGTKGLKEKKKCPYGRCVWIEEHQTSHIGGFSVHPFCNFHDVEIYGYLIQHRDMDTLLFSTDTYKMGAYITGVNHYLIEANYSDDILKDNVWKGKIDKKQSDRIMLSHMSFDYTVKYLRDCGAENADTITLCHLSERNSDPQLFQKTIESSFGVPCKIAQKGMIVNLNKAII